MEQTAIRRAGRSRRGSIGRRTLGRRGAALATALCASAVALTSLAFVASAPAAEPGTWTSFDYTEESKHPVTNVASASSDGALRTYILPGAMPGGWGSGAHAAAGRRLSSAMSVSVTAELKLTAWADAKRTWTGHSALEVGVRAGESRWDWRSCRERVPTSMVEEVANRQRVAYPVQIACSFDVQSNEPIVAYVSAFSIECIHVCAGANAVGVEAKLESLEVTPEETAPPDTTPPDTVIDSGPSGTVSSTSATFEFHASEAGSTLECSLDGAAFAPCTSPKNYTGLAVGSHTFQVRATDQAGNTGTPASASWTVVQPPAAPQTLSASTATKGKGVQLSWSAPESDGGSAITGYKIYRATSSGAQTLLTAVGTVTSYKDQATKAGQTYYYKVSAVNEVGEGPASNEASAKAR